VLYFYTGTELTVDFIPDNQIEEELRRKEVFLSNVSAIRRFDNQLQLVRSALDEFLALRPGHEFDSIRKATIIDDFIPETAECSDESPRTKIGDPINARIIGSIVGDKTEFADTREETVIVGSSRPDFPDLLLGRGLTGLCPGMKRRMGFPSLLAFKKGSLPPGVTQNSILSFSITMNGFGSSSEVSEVHPDYARRQDL
jgi:hypothetical protein